MENGHGHAMRKSFAHPDSIARILIVATNGCTGMSMFDAYSQHLPGIVPYQGEVDRGCNTIKYTNCL